MEHRNKDIALGNPIISHICKLLLETNESLHIKISGLSTSSHILQINLLNQHFDVIPFDLREVLPNLEIV